jgi:hypothetical protein
MNLVSDLDLPEFFGVTGGPLTEHINTSLNHGPAPDVS